MRNFKRDCIEGKRIAEKFIREANIDHVRRIHIIATDRKVVVATITIPPIFRIYRSKGLRVFGPL